MIEIMLCKCGHDFHCHYLFAGCMPVLEKCDCKTFNYLGMALPQGNE